MSLPAGWRIKAVQDIGERRGGGTPSRSNLDYFKGDIPWLTVADLPRVGSTPPIIEKSREYITEDAIRQSSAKRIPKGSVLFATRVSVGKTAIAGREVATNQDFRSLLPNRSFDSRYLAHYLAFVARYRPPEDRGSTINGITARTFDTIEVPLPPTVDGQRHIANKLDHIAAHLDDTKARLDAIPTILKRFRMSVLAAAFSGRLTADWRSTGPGDVGDDPEAFAPVPASWRWSSLKSECTRIVDCPHSTPNWTESGRLCVRTTNFLPGFLDLSERRYVSDETFAQRITRLKPEPGDILYSREGGILGIACMIPPEVELCLGQRMMLFRAGQNLKAEFIMHWLNCPLILSKVRDLTGGSASPHLNVQDIKDFPVPVPPDDEQTEILRRVKSLMVQADAIAARYEKAHRFTDKLMPSVLAKAFRGELV